MIRQLSSRRVYESPYLRLREDAIEQPDGTRGIYGVVEKPDFALVVPWDGERLHLVGQYRYPVASFEWEFPQGGVEGFVPERPSEIAAARAGGGDRAARGRLQHLGRIVARLRLLPAGLRRVPRDRPHRRRDASRAVRADDGVARTVGVDELEAMIAVRASCATRRRSRPGAAPSSNAAQDLGPLIDRLHPPGARRDLDRRGADGGLAPRRGRRLRGDGRCRTAEPISRRSARRRSRSRPSSEREEVTDHDVAAFVDVLAASAGEAGRWIHFGLTSSDVLDTALALQLQARRARSSPRRTRAGRGARRARARARRHASASGAPTACTPSRRRSASSSPGFAMEAHRNARAPASSRSTRSRSARSPGAVGTYAAHRARSSRRACSRASASRAEPVSTQVVPRDRHAELLQAIALAGAGLERLATEIRHLQRTEVREVQEPFRAGPRRARARCRTSATRSRPSRSPASRACCAATRRPASRTSPCGTSATSPTPAVERVILPDSTILLDYLQHRAIALVEGMIVDADRMRAQPRAHARRAVLPARAAGARRGRHARATTPTASCRSSPSARGTRARRCASCSRPTSARRQLDLDEIFDLRALHPPRADEIVGRLDEIALSAG